MVCVKRNIYFVDYLYYINRTQVIKSDEHLEQMKFQQTEYFKAKAKHRYKIEAKNSELKNVHGYGRACSYGIANMQMQGAMAIFTVNLKRIFKLINE